MKQKKIWSPFSSLTLLIVSLNYTQLLLYHIILARYQCLVSGVNERLIEPKTL